MARINYSQYEIDMVLDCYRKFEASGHHRRHGIKDELAMIVSRSGGRLLYRIDINNILDKLQADGVIGEHHVISHIQHRKDEGTASFLTAMAQDRFYTNVRRYGPKREESIRPGVFKILAFTDPHASIGLSNERFTWLGKLAAKVKPDVINCAGDWCNWDAFSSHEKAGTIKYADKPTFAQEFPVFADSVERISAEFPEGYTPEMYCQFGNHEERIYTYENMNPVSQGMFTSQVEDTFNKHGWQTTPYGAHVFIHGIKFTHSDFNAMNKTKAISRIKTDATCDQYSGHTHKLVNELVTKDSGAFRVMNGGCFMPHGYRPKYTLNADDWWYGCQILMVTEGRLVSAKEISILELEAEYGNH